MVMQVTNAVHPSPRQGHTFFGMAEDGPFVMVNLLKFREKAAYPGGAGEDLSGAQAYGRYSAEVAGLIERAGGRILFSGAVTGLLIGECDVLWDMVALVEYPSLAAFRGMVMSPEYQAIAVHRSAGLEGQLNIKTEPAAR